MFRYLFQLIALLLFFAIARSVITWVMRTLVQGFRTTTAQTPPARSSGSSEVMTSAGDLYRDPVCGTFVPANTAYARTVNGEKHYFCSANCRDQFSVTAR